jgi:hypothetical protein
MNCSIPAKSSVTEMISAPIFRVFNCVVGVWLIAVLSIGAVHGQENDGMETLLGKLKSEFGDPLDMFRLIGPMIREPDSEEDLNSDYIISKWTNPIVAKVIAPNDERITQLVADTLQPVATQIGENTGLKMEFSSDVTDFNVLFLALDQPMDLLPLISQDELRRWFQLEDDEFEIFMQAVKNPDALCFRYVKAPDGVLVRAVMFVSLKIDLRDQQKCIARSLAYIVGLRGQTWHTPSVKGVDEDPRLYPIDQLALQIIYSPTIKPGTSVGEAFQTHSQD